MQPVLQVLSTVETLVPFGKAIEFRFTKRILSISFILQDRS